MGQKKEVLEEVVNEILDEMTLGLCFELHRSCKLGTLFLEDIDAESEKQFEIITMKGRDVFGHLTSSKKQYDCICPKCKHSMAASRFAPHLEKCMGMGGTGPRLSSRRTAVRSHKRASDIESEDNSDDDDWSYGGDKKAKKAKKEKKSHSPKKSKHKSKQRDDDDSDAQRSHNELKTEKSRPWDINSSSPTDSSSTVARKSNMKIEPICKRCELTLMSGGIASYSCMKSTQPADHSSSKKVKKKSSLPPVS